jgi:DNA-binding NtrC family response regulator
VKEQLEKLVLEMHRRGILYAEALRAFRSVFILTALKEEKANQAGAAQKLHMHRNTLRRLIREFEIGV